MACARFLAVAVTASACGRIGYDPRSDAPTDTIPAHDEDGDGFDDLADVCPHISDSAQVDTDADGVGDPCDPNPAGRDTIVLFDPFVDPTAQWSFLAAPPTLDGESIRVDTTSGEMAMHLEGFVAGKDTLTVGGEFGATTAVNRRQLTLVASETSLEFLYCEKYEYMGVEKWGLIWTMDDFLFNTADNGNLVETIANHTFRTSMSLDPITHVAGCTTTFPVDKRVLQANIPVVTPTEYRLYVQGINILLDYAIVIRSE